MSLRARAYCRSSDADTVAIHIHHLIGNIHEDNDRTGGRNLGVPNVISRFERGREGFSRITLGETGRRQERKANALHKSNHGNRDEE